MEDHFGFASTLLFFLSVGPRADDTSFFDVDVTAESGISSDDVIALKLLANTLDEIC